MKTLKIGLMALVFAVGIGGAVAEKIHAAPKPADPIYNWTKAGSSSFTGTVSQAESNYGCNNLAVGCAHGTLAPGQSGPATADIKQ